MANKERKRNIFLMVLTFLSGLLPIVTFSACYVAAMKLGHLDNSTKIPWLTELGAYPQEGILLSTGFAMTSLVKITVIFAKYAQVFSLVSRPCHLPNVISCYFGWLMILAEFLLSSIRHKDAAWAHYFAKALYMSTCCLYLTLQLYISMQHRDYYRRYLPCSRLTLTILIIACPFLLITGLVFQELHALDVPQCAELAFFLLISIYWMSLSADFYDRPMMVFKRYESAKDNTKVCLRCRKRDNSKAIVFLSDIVSTEIPEYKA